MVCVGASFERRGMIWQKQSSNRCFWQASCVTGFSFYSLVQLSLTESLTEMLRHLILIRGIGKNGGVIHTIEVWSCFAHIDISTDSSFAEVVHNHNLSYLSFCMITRILYLSQLYNRGSAAGWELCRLTEGRRVGITWTEEAFGVHCKHHHLYFAALNWVLIQTFRQWLIRVFQ